MSVGPDGWYACEKDEESCDYDRLWQQMEARCVTEVCYGEQAASGPCELFCNWMVRMDRTSGQLVDRWPLHADPAAARAVEAREAAAEHTEL